MKNFLTFACILIISYIGINIGLRDKPTVLANTAENTNANKIVYSQLPEFLQTRIVQRDTVYDTVSVVNNYSIVVNGHKDRDKGEYRVKTVTREVPVLFIAKENQGDRKQGTPKYTVQKVGNDAELFPDSVSELR